MLLTRLSRIGIAVAMSLSVAACGGGFSGIGSQTPAQQAAVADGADPYNTSLQGSGNAGQDQVDAYVAALGVNNFYNNAAQNYYDPDRQNNGIFGLFGSNSSNTTVEVNKYIWNASLDVLSFLPIESVDPFTGVIVTGYGTVPGGNKAYRATVYVNDPALDARSLKLAMQTKGGAAVSPETLKAVEDAILSRARQLRIADTKL
jgi:hypothetical protein